MSPIKWINRKTVKQQNIQINICQIVMKMNRNQIKELIEDFTSTYGFLPPLEMVVYGRYQTMITKHCFISKEQIESNPQ